MTTTTIMIPEVPETYALAEAEPRIRDWLEDESDFATLREAKNRLDALHTYYARGSEDAAAARRLSLDAERRMGQLPEAASVPAGRPAQSAQPVRNSHAEGIALSRARALANVPVDTYEQVRASPRPSRAAAVTAAKQETPIEYIEPPAEPETEWPTVRSKTTAAAIRLLEQVAVLDWRSAASTATDEQYTRLRRAAKRAGRTCAILDAPRIRITWQKGDDR